MKPPAFDPDRLRKDPDGNPLCLLCDDPAVLNDPVLHKGRCDTAETAIHAQADSWDFRGATGVTDAHARLLAAQAESQNPKLAHIDWAGRLGKLDQDMQTRVQHAQQLHAEHLARAVAESRAGHTHPGFCCAGHDCLVRMGVHDDVMAQLKREAAA